MTTESTKDTQIEYENTKETPKDDMSKDEEQKLIDNTEEDIRLNVKCQKYESLTPHAHRILARKQITKDSQMYILYRTTLDKAEETDVLRDPIIREIMERIGEESDTEVNNMLRDVWIDVYLSPL